MSNDMPIMINSYEAKIGSGGICLFQAFSIALFACPKGMVPSGGESIEGGGEG